MAYKYYKITDFDPALRPYYFFDANVWIAVLAGRNTINVKPYVDFFEAVINLNILQGKALSKLQKQNKYQPKIIMTSLLMSEIFNAYMRKVAMKQYYPEHEYKNKEYKGEYRKTADHSSQLIRLKENFLSYQDFFELKNDKFGDGITPSEICNQLLSDADFNDFYYYFRFYDEKIPLVTDDGDFIFQGVEVITNNKNLFKFT